MRALLRRNRMQLVIAAAFALGLGMSSPETASAAQPIGECTESHGARVPFQTVMMMSRLISAGCEDVVMLCWLADADNNEHPYGVGCMMPE